MSIRDLRALARLPGWLLRAAIVVYSNERIDWQGLADLQRKLTPEIREKLESAKIPANQWSGIDPKYIPAIAVLRSVGLRVKRLEHYGYSPIVEITTIERNGIGIVERNGALLHDFWLELKQIRALAVFEAISSDSLEKAAEELPKLKSLAEIEAEDDRVQFFRPLLETLRAYLRSRMEDRCDSEG